ncbi:MAG: penicillin acylase family protein [Sandaracinaceae bacterium]|nr:penicillin acylase family protein [Sandaracinaceae bacterium]
MTLFATHRLPVPLFCLFLTAAVASSCGSDAEHYEARIIRTAYGVPHILAEDFGGLGYGYGYAYAQDNYCVLMREVIRSEGATTRWWGESGGSLAEDLVYRFYNTDELARREFLGPLPGWARSAVRGYAAGMNRHLREVGVEGLAQGDEGCRDEPWVREITELDLAKVYRKLGLRATTGQLAPLIAAAHPPESTLARIDGPPQLPGRVPELTPVAMGFTPPSEMGSNAYAVGSDSSRTGAGLLLGNPHFPWSGTERFYQAHLTIPGVYDVAGASLQGVPVINIGFNENVAWSHTVAASRHFAFYELTLDPEDPMVYIYDGERRQIEAHPVELEVMLADGSLETRELTLYTSHFGPIVDLSAISSIVGGWPTLARSAITFRDANMENDRLVEQWVRMGQAEDMDAFEEALAFLGIPWVNTIAASRDGQAYYGDITTIPNITDERFEDCSQTPIARLLSMQTFPSLDGSRSACEWGSTRGAPDGIQAYEDLPHLRTTDYVANANDSFWLSNPRELLEGFSPFSGFERYQQSVRTRQAFAQAEERLAGTDGLGPAGFVVEDLMATIFDGRSYAAELTMEGILTVCAGTSDWSSFTSDVTRPEAACAVLSAWDRRFLPSSQGAHLFREVYERVRNVRNLYATPFDANDPVGTPRDVATDDVAVADGIRSAIVAATARLDAASIPLDRMYSEVQFRVVGSERIPIPGMLDSLGFSVTTSSLVDGEGYSRIRHGNSHMQAVTWDDGDPCPRAYTMLTYSQSTDPASPHYADQTRVYSMGQWNEFPFCEADVVAAAVSTETIVGP